MFEFICCCRKGELFPLQATVNVKLGPPLRLHFGFNILLVGSSSFAYFGLFFGDLGFSLFYNPCCTLTKPNCIAEMSGL